ncbi:MAG: anthranilate phosphoribosyltransferase [Clostridia bacterium]|nr:anthranilate phosphoribosyltransferase [Clostridia bacterium]
MMQSAIKKLVEGKSLTEQEIIEAMNCIMEGEATQAQIGSFITALRIKGETIDEITGCAKVMRQKADRIVPQAEYFIDTCGTGGDGANTFNISTAVAFVSASAGVTVAKHGNRSVSSRCGCADVLEALGVNIQLSPEQVKECIDRVGIGFMFAPTFHKSMKHAAGPRRELGIRTIFNILGPLTNPATAKGQVLGVFDEKLTEPMANVLLNLGLERAMVVHGMDGLDEITTTNATKVSELKNGTVSNYEITPEKFGLTRVDKAELAGGDSATNAEIIKSIFNRSTGPKRDIVLMNSAAALYVGKAVDSIEAGIEKAAELIDSGKVLAKLNEFAEFTVNLAGR